MLKICWLISKVSTQLIALLGSATLAVVELLFELGHDDHRLAIADMGVGTSKFFGFGRQGRYTPDHPSGRYRCNSAELTQA